MKLGQGIGAWGLAVVVSAWACSSGNGASLQVSETLELLPAPGGLCGGDAAPKECTTPDGCPAYVPPNPDASTNGTPGFAASTGGTGFSSGGTGFSSGGAAGPQVPPITIDTDSGAAGSPGNGGDDFPIDDAGGEGGAAPVIKTLSLGGSAAFKTKSLAHACDGLERSQPATLYLSADDSASMASPVIARSLIRRGARVPAGLVRPFEFLNYYQFNFQPAAPGEVSVVPQLSSCPQDGQLSFQVALQSERRSADQRAPLNLTLVLDTSGSMQGEPIALERAAVRAIAKQLRFGDIVSVVTWDTDQRDLLVGRFVTGASDAALLKVLDKVQASGGTDLDGGLKRGYELAKKQAAPDRINRVLVISDGIANVGQTNSEMIAKNANDEEGGNGIYLAGIGVGDGVNDTLLNAVTDAGRGAYVFLDSAAEAEKMLGERFLTVVDIAARAVRLELTLPWYFQVQKFYGEAISTDASKVYPQHLGPNDAMLFFQILQACDASLIKGTDTIRMRATWQTPFTREPRERTLDLPLNLMAGDHPLLGKAAAIAGYAEALARFDLASDPAQRHALVAAALGHVRAVPNFKADPDLAEVESLLQKLDPLAALP